MIVEIEQFRATEYQEALAAIRSQSKHTPRVGLILGSGLMGIADAVEAPDVIPYPAIPHFPRTTAAGHEGRLVLGTLEGQPVLVMQGRTHLYEGCSLQRITFPIRVMRLLGVEILVVTNAAGGINAEFQVGDLMLIRDHINLVGMGGMNPLRGPNDPAFGPRFPDMTRAYDLELRNVAREVAARESLSLREGVYVMVAGPSYETPAELRFLRAIGADAVGMSTAAEVTVACHCGLRVLGVSTISNVALLDPKPGQVVSHEEVLAAGKTAGPRLTRLIRGVLRALP